MPGLHIVEHIMRVEREEGKTFLEVLKELAASGESKSSSAEILEIPQPSLCKWLRNSIDPQVQQIGWPKAGQSNGFMANVLNNTPARQAARLRNLGLRQNWS